MALKRIFGMFSTTEAQEYQQVDRVEEPPASASVSKRLKRRRVEPEPETPNAAASAIETGSKQITPAAENSQYTKLLPSFAVSKFFGSNWVYEALSFSDNTTNMSEVAVLQTRVLELEAQVHERDLKIEQLQGTQGGTQGIGISKQPKSSKSLPKTTKNVGSVAGKCRDKTLPKTAKDPVDQPDDGSGLSRGKNKKSKKFKQIVPKF